jgi:hypothetical protein
MKVLLDGPGTTGGLADSFACAAAAVFRVNMCIPWFLPGLAVSASWLGSGNLTTRRSFLPSDRDCLRSKRKGDEHKHCCRFPARRFYRNQSPFIILLRDLSAQVLKEQSPIGDSKVENFG